MQKFIVLRDKAGNWERPRVTLQAVAAPKWPGAPGAPVLDIVENRPDRIADLCEAPDVLFVTPVMATRMIGPEPLDDLREDEADPGWALRALCADRTPFSGRGSRVALLDTGIEASHASFDGVTLHGRDFVGTGLDDAHGHGTHLAGTVLGRDLGGTRIGVARGADSLWVAKTVTDEGRGQSDQFLQALLWAMAQGVDIIGFALKFDVQAEATDLLQQGYPERLCQATALTAYRGNLRMLETILMMLGERAPLVVAAVGNDSLRTIAPDLMTGPSAPAAARGVMDVGSAGQGDRGLRASPFCNAGPAVMAPGEAIASARPGGGTRLLNGTSMAMAQAVGVAALWAEKLRASDQPVSAQTLAAALVNNAQVAPFDADSTVFDHGKGLIQAPLA